MLLRLDHVGVVAHSWDEAAAVLLDTLGFALDASRSTLPDGLLFLPENTRLYFVNAGVGETRIEVLVPQDTVSGIARYLARRGPGLHHLGYAVEDVAEDARRLRERGLQQIDLGPNAPDVVFFHPKGALGVLTELVPDRPLAEWGL